MERDSSEDDDEMLEGVASWEYLKRSGQAGSENESEAEGSDPMDEDEVEDEKVQDPPEEEESELSELEDEAEEATPPPAKANGRKAKNAAGPSSKTPTKATLVSRGKAASKPAPAVAKGPSRSLRGRKPKSDAYAMDEDDDD